MFRRGQFLLILSVLTVAVAAHGQETIKIGFVDRDELLKTGKIKAQIDQLAAEGDTRETEFRKKETEYKAKVDAFNEKKSFMGEPEKEKAREEIDQLGSQLLEFSRSQVKEMKEIQEGVKGKVMSEVREVVRQVALEQGYTIVLWKHTLAYGKESYDLTAEVKKRLESGGN